MNDITIQDAWGKDYWLYVFERESGKTVALDTNNGLTITDLDIGSATALRDFLTKWLSDKPTPPDDPRVTELIEAAKAYVQWQLTGEISLTSMSEQLQRLNRASAAFDPPDPDLDLRKDIKILLETRAYSDVLQDLINMVRNYDASK